jgi:hypothetical protein
VEAIEEGRQSLRKNRPAAEHALRLIAPTDTLSGAKRRAPFGFSRLGLGLFGQERACTGQTGNLLLRDAEFSEDDAVMLPLEGRRPNRR